MTQAKTNLLLALAILTGALSLPMEWFTLNDVFVDDSFFSGRVSALDGATLFSIPVWTLVATALMASGMQMIDTAGFCDVPAYVKWGASLVAVIGLTLAMVFPLAVPGVTANVGAFPGLLSSAIPVVALAIGTRKQQQTVAAEPLSR